MRRMVKLGLIALTLGGPRAGCVVHERVVAHPASPCAGAVWIQGGYDHYGRWHSGHWRCPGHPYNVY